MSETIRTIELVNDSAITERDLNADAVIDAIDVNQSDGSIMTVESNSNGEYLGRLTVYPQDLRYEGEDVIELTSVDRGGDLYYTLDGRFDHIRRKIWLADTGNHRIVKLNYNNYGTDIILDDLSIYYPHSLVVNFNIGGVFVKGYADEGRTDGIIYYLKSNGDELANFKFTTDDFISSSSSSSDSLDSSSSSSDSFDDESSSSSSGIGNPPPMPSSRSMAFDYVRSRLWWLHDTKVYLLDVRSKQIKTYDLGLQGVLETRTIDLDLNTGNAFVVGVYTHGTKLYQMNRDNNKYLGSIFVEA